MTAPDGLVLLSESFRPTRETTAVINVPWSDASSRNLRDQSAYARFPRCACRSTNHSPDRSRENLQISPAVGSHL